MMLMSQNYSEAYFNVSVYTLFFLLPSVYYNYICVIITFIFICSCKVDCAAAHLKYLPSYELMKPC